jgi:hypothetical protein
VVDPGAPPSPDGAGDLARGILEAVSWVADAP